MARFAAHSYPVIAPVMVGRDAELTAGAAWLTNAITGVGTLALITGEAGIGKSCLAHAVSEMATARGFRFLRGVCGEHDRAYPFAPLLDAFRQQLRRASRTNGTDALFGPDAPLFARLLPELAPAAAAPLAPLPPEAEKRRLFEAFVRVFARLAEVTPLLVVLEDLHWADEATLDLLALLPRRLAASRVLVLGTARTDEPGSAVPHWRAGLTRAGLLYTLDLAPLASEDVNRLIASAPRPPSPLAVAAIQAQGEGNPFFIEELLRAWAEADTDTHGGKDADNDEPPPIPASVRDAVTHHFDALDAPTRAVAEAAAAIGQQFALGTLAAVLGCEPAALAPALRALVAAYLVTEGVDDRFAFRHALTREAVYARLLAVERRQWHGAVARALAADTAAGVAVPAGELGYHAYAAGEWEAAVRWCGQAGNEALALHVPHAAITHFTRAITAATRIGAPLSALLHVRGQAYSLLGTLHRAERDYEAALLAARACSDDMGAMQACIALGVRWSGQDPARSRSYYAQALVLARVVGDRAAAARTLTRIAYLHIDAGEPTAAEPYTREALALAVVDGNRREIAQAHGILCMARWGGADLLTGLDEAREALAGFAVAGDLVDQAFAHTQIVQVSAIYAVECAVPAASLALGIIHARSALSLAEQSGSRVHEAQAHIILARALRTTGEYGCALTHLERGAAMVHEMEHAQLHYFVDNARHLLFRDLLMLPRARQHLERSLVRARALPGTAALHDVGAHLVSVLLESDNHARARALLAELLPPDASPMALHTLIARRLWLARAELALADGDAASALAIVDALIATAPNISDRGDRGIPLLSLWRGRALAALDRTTEAEAALRAAAETAEALDARGLLWRIWCALGTVHAAAGQTRAAAAAFAEAREIIGALATTLPDDGARAAFLRAATARIPLAYRRPARRVPTPPRPALTPREREVAALVGNGATNRAVATALFITEKTVEAHLTRSLRKLGLRSRADLMRWAQAQALTTPASPTPARETFQG